MTSGVIDDSPPLTDLVYCTFNKQTSDVGSLAHYLVFKQGILHNFRSDIDIPERHLFLHLKYSFTLAKMHILIVT